MILKKWVFFTSAIAIAISILTLEVRETFVIYDCNKIDSLSNVPYEVFQECIKIRSKKAITI
jgi:hypothetical protein